MIYICERKKEKEKSSEKLYKPVIGVRNLDKRMVEKEQKKVFANREGFTDWPDNLSVVSQLSMTRH